MNCVQCGSILPEGTNICPYCGHLTQGAPPPQAQGAPPPYEPYGQPQGALPPQQQAYYPPPPGAPQGGYAGGPADKLPSFPLYLTLSILLTVLCCQPLGIVGIVFAAMINSRLNERNYEGARQFAKYCRIVLWIGLGLTVLLFIVTILLSIYSLSWLPPMARQFEFNF